MSGKQIVSTCHENVVCSSGDISLVVCSSGDISLVVCSSGDISLVVCSSGDISLVVCSSGDISRVVCSSGDISLVVRSSGDISLVSCSSGDISLVSCSSGDISLVSCSSGDISLGNLAPCTQKEADTRLLVHAADCVKQRHSIVIIRTPGTEVVVLAISISQQLGAKELWTSFETGKHFGYIAIHGIASKLGPDKCKALPVFHAITGCDSLMFLSSQEGATSKHGRHGLLFLL